MVWTWWSQRIFPDDVILPFCDVLIFVKQCFFWVQEFSICHVLPVKRCLRSFAGAQPGDLRWPGQRDIYRTSCLVCKLEWSCLGDADHCLALARHWSVSSVQSMEHHLSFSGFTLLSFCYLPFHYNNNSNNNKTW